MFPEIVREDIFRLETRRLWLHWPNPQDTSAPTGVTPEVRQNEALPESATGDPYRGDRDRGDRDGEHHVATMDRLRADNASGLALHLVMSGRGQDRRPFGALSLTPVREKLENCGLVLQVSLDPARRGDGLMTEAVQAVVDAAFMLTDTPLVAASARVLDPAFRRVLEKCGFAYCGTGLDPMIDRPGLVASDRLRLDRKAWASLKAWRIPGVVRHRGAVAAADCVSCG